MDRQDSSIKKQNFLHTIFITLWAVFSVVAYAAVCIPSSFIFRKFARGVGRMWCRQVLWLGGVRVITKGIEKLDPKKRYVFIANHQSLLDIPVLYTGLKNPLSFIAKKELFFIPVFGWGMAAIGHIWIDRTNARKARASITRAVNKLQKENQSLVLFPEGTRSVTGKVGDFKQGSFALAIESGVEVVPVAIRNTNKLLPKKDLVMNKGVAFLEVGDPISVEGYTNHKKAELSEKVKDVIVRMVEQTEK